MPQRMSSRAHNAQRGEGALAGLNQTSTFATPLHRGANVMRLFALSASFLTVGQLHFGAPPL